jgi:hypothetical protein
MKQWKLANASVFRAILVSSVVATFLTCGDKKKNDNSNGGGPGGPGGPGTQSPLNVTADLNGAVGVLIVDTNGGGSMGAGLHGFKNASLLEDSNAEKSSLVKLDSDGNIQPAITAEQPETQNMGGPSQQLPKIMTIAVSPHKDVYIHFERAFLYRQPEDPSVDVWEMSNGYQCQIFKVKGGTLDTLMTSPPEANNLECIDNQRFIDSWRANRNSVFQFDDESNVYYPASPPNSNGKSVVYKRTRDGSQTTEVINANICVNDFLITKLGGVFYTGNSSCDGGGGGDGGGFFRYVAPAGGGVREIARDWWNFVFEPKAGANATDTAVFFGPDPRSSTTASWNSACLFNFDPSAGDNASDSIDEVITCGSDIWNWINVSRPEDRTEFGNGNDENDPIKKAAWVTEFQNRCESQGQIFAGGGSQINAIKQDSEGNVYVIGKVRKKKEGEIQCGLQVRGQHCVLDNIPYLLGDAVYGTEALCQAAGGLWKGTTGWCDGLPQFTTKTECNDNNAANEWRYTSEGFSYNNVISDMCTDMDNSQRVENVWSVSDPDRQAIERETNPVAFYSSNWFNCQPVGGTTNGGGDQWTDEYRALAIVDDETKTLAMLSGTDEQAVQIWLVDDMPYYSTYNTGDGKYYLKRYNSGTGTSAVLHSNFEAYNIAPGSSEGSVFYDGLDFSNNSYSFGTMETTEPYARTEKTGLTGTVKTIVILPKD